MKNLLSPFTKINRNGETLQKDIEFVTQYGKTFKLSIYDDGVYSIKWPCLMSFKRIKNFNPGDDDEELNQIDPGFKQWLEVQLKQFYEL